MDRETQIVGERLTAVLKALLVLVSTDGDDDGRVLNPETQREYIVVLKIAAEAGLLNTHDRSVLEDVAARWGRHPAVVRELLTSFISEVLVVARGPGLAAVVECVRAERKAR